MAGYTKIFSEMLDSTVWQLSKEARLLWLTMLLKKDGKQQVMASVPGLAHAARLTVIETEAALEELLKPDPYSRTPEREGRRLLVVPGGWEIVNGALYRDKLNEDDRREYKKEWARKKRKGNPMRPMNGVTAPLPGERAYVSAVENGEAI